MSNQWLSKYRSNKNAVWIKCKLTNGEQRYCDEFAGWIGIKKTCEKEKCFISELKLSFRSHEVDIDLEEAEAVYLIRSAMGSFGSETKNYIQLEY